MLIKYSGKYVKIYFNMKITFQLDVTDQVDVHEADVPSSGSSSSGEATRRSCARCRQDE